MHDRPSHLRVFEGGGEPDPPDADRPYTEWELPEAYADPDVNRERLFATYRARHNKRKSERDYSFASTAREYARRLVADADASDRRELVALLNDVGVRDVTDSAHIIWDDAPTANAPVARG